MPNQLPNDNRRKEALRRLNAKHGFRWHLFTYTVINFGLVMLWYFLEDPYSRGFFWPVWTIAGWSAALSYHGWMVYGAKSITEAEIEREMRTSGYTADESAEETRQRSNYTADESAEETRQRSNYTYVNEDKFPEEGLPPELSKGAFWLFIFAVLGILLLIILTAS